MIYSTFNEYLTKPKSLTFEEMQELHDMILADISGDVDGKELYEALIQTAVRYAGIRAEWCLLDLPCGDQPRYSCAFSAVTTPQPESIRSGMVSPLKSARALSMARTPI